MRLALAALVLVAGCGGTTASPSPSPERLPVAVPRSAAACRVTVRYGETLPDQRCTPGAVNPAVTQDTISSTICVPGWTKTVRPPTSYTTPHKRISMQQYGVTALSKDVEYDHRVPLAVAGSPSDLKNLWPEPIADAKRKDQAEVAVQHAVCSGKLTLQQGQAIFLTGQWAHYESNTS